MTGTYKGIMSTVTTYANNLKGRVVSQAIDKELNFSEPTLASGLVDYDD